MEPISLKYATSGESVSCGGSKVSDNIKTATKEVMRKVRNTARIVAITGLLASSVAALSIGGTAASQSSSREDAALNNWSKSIVHQAFTGTEYDTAKDASDASKKGLVAIGMGMALMAGAGGVAFGTSKKER